MREVSQVEVNRECWRPWLTAELVSCIKGAPAQLQWVLICRKSRPCIIRFSNFSKGLKKSEFLYKTSRFSKYGRINHICVISVCLIVNFCSVLSRKLLGIYIHTWWAHLHSESYAVSYSQCQASPEGRNYAFALFQSLQNTQ